MENCELYKLINTATAKSFHRALDVLDNLEAVEVRRRTKNNNNTYLHLVVFRLVDLYKCEEDVRSSLPLIYRLALRGVDVNAQNAQGNTALHMACFRPHGDVIAQHLVRIGVDPGIINEVNCRVIHHNSEHKCWTVRGQKRARCSIWNAVAREDTTLIEEYLRSWCRVNTRRRRKTLLDVAYDTGNYRIVEQLLRYKNTNELVTTALACDQEGVKALLGLKSDKCNKETQDFSQEVPKPLLAELKDFGAVAEPIIKMLKQQEYLDDKPYFDILASKATEFESADFHRLVLEGTTESLKKAWDELHLGRVNLRARSSMDNGTYLHFLVAKYLEVPDSLAVRRLLIRIMSKLALEGVDMQARDTAGRTALLAAYTEPPDRILLDQLILLGVDTSIRSNSGLCIAVNTYATRGDLMLKREHDRRYMPGLFTAVEDGDMKRVKFWLQALCRVEVCKSGRSLLELARDLGDQEIVDLLEKYHHVTEFAAAAIAGDLQRMKQHIAKGDGKKKVNVPYKNYFAGFTEDWRTETVVRPLIINVMEYCTNEICSYMIQFEARLDVHYEECAPCGPAAFWAFRDDIEADISMSIAHHADLSLRDELGATLLHRAVSKRDSPENKRKVLDQFLARDADVSARDLSGKTPRDYCMEPDTIDGEYLAQMIDDYVLNLSYVGDYDALEQLILDNYDHILDIKGTERNKTAKELAYLRYYKELLELLDEIPKYQDEINQIHTAVIKGDLKGFARLASEKRVPWGVDNRGRNILHMAVLFQRHELVSAICEQFPAMINKGDALHRTPVHYAVCLRDQRATLSLISTSNSVDMNAREANNMTVLDYIEQMERPTPQKLKSRGRRVYNYQVRNMIETEKTETPQYMEEEVEEEVEVAEKVEETIHVPPQEINISDIKQMQASPVKETTEELELAVQEVTVAE